jgi:hypothetical protein
MEISMRRAVASSVAVMMMIGGGASYALLGRHSSHKMELSSSAMDAPRVESARMFSAPIAPPEPDLIAAKLAPQPTLWPDAPKQVVKAKRPEAAGMQAKAEASKAAANPAGPKSLGTKSATAPQAKPKPKPKKQASVEASVEAPVAH